RPADGDVGLERLVGRPVVRNLRGSDGRPGATAKGNLETVLAGSGILGRQLELGRRLFHLGVGQLEVRPGLDVGRVFKVEDQLVDRGRFRIGARQDSQACKGQDYGKHMTHRRAPYGGNRSYWAWDSTYFLSRFQALRVRWLPSLAVNSVGRSCPGAA